MMVKLLITIKTNKMENTELSTKYKVLQLIENLENDTDYNTINVYQSPMPEWEYYYAIRGFYKEKYFHVTIQKFKEYCDSYKVMVADLTDCKEEINEKLKQFKLL